MPSLAGGGGGCGLIVDGGEFLHIRFVEVSCEIRGVYPVREDKNVAAGGCASVGMSTVYSLFKSCF